MNKLRIQKFCCENLKGRITRIEKMKTKEECIRLINSCKQELQQEYGIRSLRIFGSVARNEHTEANDVDICIEADPTGLIRFAHLKHFFENLLECSVDLIRMNRNMDTFLKDQIERDGIIVFR